MNIINSDIVTSEYDVFWKDVSATISNAETVPVLVITEQYAPSAPHKAQLHKMLGACGLSDDQYYNLEMQAGDMIAWHKLRALFQPRVVILIGILPARLGISALFRLCEPNRFDDTIWLAAPSLASMEQQQDIKSQFWHNGLKRVFVEKAFGELVTTSA